MDEQQPWHRFFGLSWMDFFRGLPVTVEMEKDLSLKKQLLDVLVIRKQALRLECRLPDGFEDLADYNLVSFKSHKDKLSIGTLLELLGHYVNLRKQESPSMNEEELLPEERFRLFAVTARYPQGLAAVLGAGLRSIQEGVCEVEALTRRIRIVVANQLPRQEHNAMLLLFSAKDELLRYGAEHYRVRSTETSSLLYAVFRRYQREVLTMPDLLEEFTRETIDQLLKELPPEELRKRLSVEERLEGLSAEERLKGLSAEERQNLLRLLNANEGPSNPAGAAP